MALLGYARVSTLDQDPALQIVFGDKASGALDERPELVRALDHARAGDTLVVWRLDRLGRSLRHLVETVTALERRQVGFRSLSESIDTTTPGGKLVFHLFAALAEFERDLIRERTRAGLEAARARGRNGGRPSVMSKDKMRVAREPVLRWWPRTARHGWLELGRGLACAGLEPGEHERSGGEDGGGEAVLDVVVV